MCKPFPPPLVRGGVFLVGLETKYRDIADGNIVSNKIPWTTPTKLETKYRDIADGNRCPTSSRTEASLLLETKYRDIADGNLRAAFSNSCRVASWKPSTAI